MMTQGRASSQGLWLATGLLLIGAFLRFYALQHYPQGLHYDEAVNVIVSREIAFEGARPFPVFAAFNGREVFYFYANALAMLGMGDSPFVLRVVSAMMNLITIAATIGMGRVWFGKSLGLWIGLSAGAFLAVSFPQIFIARQNFRAVSQPMLQALCLWAIGRGLKQNKSFPSYLWLGGAGFLGGAVLYTYMASRLFPGWLAGMWGLLWLVDAKRRGKRFIQATVMLGVLFLTGFPIIRYYLDNRDVFEDRLSQLSASDDTPSYADSVQLHAEMFFVRGDPYIRYNEPFAPYFDPFTGILLVIGLGVATWGIFRAKDATQRAISGLILVAPLMVIPSVLAVGGLPPSHMRSIGMVPFIFFLPALGAVGIIQWLQGKLPQLRQWVMPLSSGVIIVLTVWVWGRYETWASAPEMYYQTDGDMYAAGQWLVVHSDSDTVMYVTSQHYDHPTLLVNVPSNQVQFLLGERLFLPPPNVSAYIVETHNAPLSPTLKTWTADFIRQAEVKAPDGSVSFTVYRYDTNQSPYQDVLHSGENVGDWLRLVDTDLPIATAGNAVTVTSVWYVLATPTYEDLTPLFQIETPTGDLLGRVEPYTRYSNRWLAGAFLIQTVTFDVPFGTPPGAYPIRVSWVGRAADEYVSRFAADGSFAGIWTDLGELSVTQASVFPSPENFSVSVVQPTDFTNGVRLYGWHWGDKPILRPGEKIAFDLIWQAQRDNPDDVPLRFYAVRGDESYLLWEGTPAMDTYPFSLWRAGEVIVDRHRWRLPTEIPSGDYHVELSLASQTVTLGEVEILPVNRRFDPPISQQTLALNLGDIVALSGYDLSSTTVKRGEALNVTLYWQLLAESDLPLKVFVHLVGPDGIIYDQRDSQPQNYTYPVSLWAVGEYVSDPYALTVPENAPLGAYTIRIGMYLDVNGQRLNIQDAEGISQGDMWTLAEIEINE